MCTQSSQKPCSNDFYWMKSKFAFSKNHCWVVSGMIENTGTQIVTAALALHLLLNFLALIDLFKLRPKSSFIYFRVYINQKSYLYHYNQRYKIYFLLRLFYTRLNGFRSQMLDFQYSYSNVIAKGEMRWQWFCISRETYCNGQPLVKHWILTLVLRTRVKIQCITRGLTRETLYFCTRASHSCKNLMYHS